MPIQKIFITGATGGIGGAVARKLARRGRSLSLTGRDPAKLEALAAECELAGALHAHARAADLAVSGAAEQTVAEAWRALDGIDAVIHCAGVGLLRPTAETSEADFRHVMELNAHATFSLAQAAAKRMAEQKRGLFVTLPGILGKAPMRGAAAYAASKFAVTGMLRCMALEYQRSGVRFSLLHLGGVDTPFWDRIDLKVQRDKMIPADTAADCVLAVLDTPEHLVLGELVLQPESHQL